MSRESVTSSRIKFAASYGTRWTALSFNAAPRPVEWPLTTCEAPTASSTAVYAMAHASDRCRIMAAASTYIAAQMGLELALGLTNSCSFLSNHGLGRKFRAIFFTRYFVTD